MTPHLTVVAAVEKVDPWRNQSLQPRNGLTWCNRFARLVCDELGVTLGGVLANEQAEWLNGLDAVKCGWASASEQAARQWAQGGGLALATWRNPVSGGHGHIAVLVPALPGAPVGVTFIAQAGVRNFAHEPITHGFGGLAPQFHTYSPSRVCSTSPEAPHA